MNSYLKYYTFRFNIKPESYKSGNIYQPPSHQELRTQLHQPIHHFFHHPFTLLTRGHRGRQSERGRNDRTTGLEQPARKRGYVQVFQSGSSLDPKATVDSTASFIPDRAFSLPLPNSSVRVRETDRGREEERVMGTWLKS